MKRSLVMHLLRSTPGKAERTIKKYVTQKYPNIEPYIRPHMLKWFDNIRRKYTDFVNDREGLAWQIATGETIITHTGTAAAPTSSSAPAPKPAKEPLDLAIRRVSLDVKKGLRSIEELRSLETKLYLIYSSIKRRVPKAIFYLHLGTFRSVVERVAAGTFTLQQLLNFEYSTRDPNRAKKKTLFFSKQARARFSAPKGRFKLSSLRRLSSANFFVSSASNCFFDEFSSYKTFPALYSRILTGQHLASVLKSPSYLPL